MLPERVSQGGRGRNAPGGRRSGRTPTPSRSHSPEPDPNTNSGRGAYVRGLRPASPRAGGRGPAPERAAAPPRAAGEPGWLYVSGLPEYMTMEEVRRAVYGL